MPQLESTKATTVKDTDQTQSRLLAQRRCNDQQESRQQVIPHQV